MKRNKSPNKKDESVANTDKATSAKENNQKVMITGDDILIEYVSRLMHLFTTDRVREETLATE